MTGVSGNMKINIAGNIRKYEDKYDEEDKEIPR
jgi:hypothetical protein